MNRKYHFHKLFPFNSRFVPIFFWIWEIITFINSVLLCILHTKCKTHFPLKKTGCQGTRLCVVLCQNCQDRLQTRCTAAVTHASSIVPGDVCDEWAQPIPVQAWKTRPSRFLLQIHKQRAIPWESPPAYLQYAIHFPPAVPRCSQTTVVNTSQTAKCNL